MLSIVVLFDLCFLVGIIGAVFCILDHDFNNSLIGRWLKGKLFGEQIREEETEEWETTGSAVFVTQPAYYNSRALSLR